jgi:4-methyl-5(b-hydroxyethyl)-thiazole monophosphate biosynthesis
MNLKNEKLTKKVIAFYYPGCIPAEITFACKKLQPYFVIENMTLDGKDHETIKAHLSLESFNLSKVDNYHCLLIPGGDPGICIGNQKLNFLVQRFHAQKKILAAICAGPIILNQAGILEGQRIAHGYKGSQLEFVLKHGFFKNVELTNENLISVDHIITARPDSYKEFAEEILKKTVLIK